jgi:hypothetical protein
VLVHLGEGLVVEIQEVVAVLDANHLARTADGSALLARAAGSRPDAISARTVVVTARGLLPLRAAAATVARRIAEAPGRERRQTAER